MGIHYFKIIDREKWHQKKLLLSLKLNMTNSAAHMLLLCSMTMVSQSRLRKSKLSSRTQETPLSHTGQCFSPKPSNLPMSVISSPKLPPLVQPPVQLPLEVLPLLRKLQRKKRKNKRKMLIWEVFSVTKMITEQCKIISHIKSILKDL